MARSMAFALGLFWGLFLGLSAEVSAATLTVRVEGMKSDEGSILYALFNSPEGFPSDKSKVFRKGSIKVENHLATIKIVELAAGTYALSVIHDKNSNEKLDTGLFGIPTEGVGASNDAKGSFGPPKFKDAQFEIQRDDVNQVIHLMHLF